VFSLVAASMTRKRDLIDYLPVIATIGLGIPIK
jgi:hypothetical protein